MKNYRNLVFYILTLSLFSVLIYAMILKGETMDHTKVIETSVLETSGPWAQFADTLVDNTRHPLAILLLQIITILLAARFLGFLCQKIRQPSVIGEIAAGIFLGPSLLGMYFPEISGLLFPVNSISNLQFLSQMGLIFFMYVVGMEVDPDVLKSKVHEAVVVSHASIIFPFALGILLSFLIYEPFAGEGVKFVSFALFIGVAMSITAFPVLARIVQERGLSGTKLGTIVITCAAADDITAWCILAVVIAIVKAGSVVSVIFTVLASMVYVLFMLLVVRPFLRNLGEAYSSQGKISRSVVSVFFFVLILSSFATEIIGIHALFGAFMAGMIMPSKNNFKKIFTHKVEDVSLVLLLPLFFVFTGLRTQIGLLNEPYLWQVTAWIILVAVTGKFAGSALSARFVGQSWKESLSIGALMNTRGLMELVVLNIGYDLGVLGPEIFSMMVIMALVTTCMTGPALDLINRCFADSSPTSDDTRPLPES